MIKTVILRTASRLIVPLSLIFAVFIYCKGHQTPGGGFVGGLVAAVALILHRMSETESSRRQMLPVRERTLIGWGLLLAMGTGGASLLAGLPFLTSGHMAVALPTGPGESTVQTFEVASAMAFDLGVFFVVTGVVVGMINALTDEVE